MKIKMITTVPGSVDGCRVSTYEAGKEYDLSSTPGERDLAAAFVGANFAAEVEGDAAPAGAEPVQITLDAAPVTPVPRQPKHKK
jgi:hypothetical protein